MKRLYWLICLMALSFTALISIIFSQQLHIADLEREDTYKAQEIERLKEESASKDIEIERQKMIAEDYWWLFYYEHVSEYDGEYEYYE